MNVSQSAHAAEALLAEAVGFANISQRFAFQAAVESAFVPVGEAAMIRVTTEDPEHAVLSLLDASGVQYAAQEVSGLSIALPFMTFMAVIALTQVAENCDL